MGYDIHIHRREDRVDRDGEEITMEEWKAVYETDPSLMICGEYRYRDGDEVISVPVIGWPAPECAEAAFTLYRGAIKTKNPSECAIRKAGQIAERLSARVQGDDGEFYTADAKAYYNEPGDNDLPVEAAEPVQSAANWWQRLFRK